MGIEDPEGNDKRSDVRGQKGSGPALPGLTPVSIALANGNRPR